MTEPSAKPRVAFVVQRAGAEVIGGAESLCLQVAQRMSTYWRTEILTTCARDYMRWDNYYPAGDEMFGETLVRRFPVDRERDVDIFNALSAEIVAKGSAATLTEQEAWMRAQGPMSTRLFDYLSSAEYDAFIFFGYLYATTYFGLPLVKENAFLAPLAHDEWTIHLPMWDAFMLLPTGFIFQTPEELDFLKRRFPHGVFNGPIAGIGVEPPRNLQPALFRTKYNLPGPIVLYLGRIDFSKGCEDLFKIFTLFSATAKLRHQLVLVGQEVLPVPFHDNIIYLGFADESEKWNAIAACDWLIVPSPHESLSMSLLEAWSVGKPAIVSAASEVLVGHCRRSNGGICYHSVHECFEFLNSVGDETRGQMGANGTRYVRKSYSWERTENQYAAALEPILGAWTE